MKKFFLPTAMVAVLLSMLLVAGCSNSSDPVTDYLYLAMPSNQITYTYYPTPSAPTITVEKSEWTNGIKIKVSGDNWSKCCLNGGNIYTTGDYFLSRLYKSKSTDYETVVFYGKSEVITFKVVLFYQLSVPGNILNTSYYSDPYNFTYTPLTAPTGVTATKVDSSKAQISWNSTKAMGYKIYGGSDSNFNSATLLATVEKDKTTCEVSNSFSYFWVQASDFGGKATSDPVHYTES